MGPHFTINIFFMSELHFHFFSSTAHYGRFLEFLIKKLRFLLIAGRSPQQLWKDFLHGCARPFSKLLNIKAMKNITSTDLLAGMWSACGQQVVSMLPACWKHVQSVSEVCAEHLKSISFVQQQGLESFQSCLSISL